MPTPRTASGANSALGENPSETVSTSSHTDHPQPRQKAPHSARPPPRVEPPLWHLHTSPTQPPPPHAMEPRRPPRKRTFRSAFAARTAGPCGSAHASPCGGSTTELDPWALVLLLGTRAPRATRRNLPEPRVVVHDLDLLAIKKPLANTSTLGVHPVPLLEMDKNTLVKIPVVGLPFHHVDAVDRSQLKLIHHLLHKTLCDVREHTGDAQRRLRALDIADRRHFELSFNFSRRTTYLFIYFQ